MRTTRLDSSVLAVVLGYQPVPPVDSLTTSHAHYRRRLGNAAAFDDGSSIRREATAHLVPEGPRVEGWEEPAAPGRVPDRARHTLTMASRVEIVDARVAELVRLGASVDRRTKGEEPGDEFYYVVMRDPEGNEFCIS